MTNDETKSLCVSLLYADHEDDVIAILRKNKLWDDESKWRLYGDRSGNFATIGNQVSRPEAALVEKVVNAVDARLMNACLVSRIDPASSAAPRTIRDAVAKFFEGREREAGSRGTLRDWASGRRTEESAKITIAATGTRREPSLSIVDRGEGQSPDRISETFLSIDRDNKLRIQFVQGKFNMGGTGALRFCGKNSIQLIITKRNPEIVRLWNENDSDADCWGFTVVRRERPTGKAGDVRNSIYTYLAPIGADETSRHGKVLRFRADVLNLMPRYNEPYVENIEWGSALKLYNYEMKGFASHILMKDGLLYRLEILLPEIALPVRMHECRDFRGKAEASFVTTMSGLIARLEEGKGGNLEDGFPRPVPFTVNGQSMIAKIYAFQKGKAETYRTNEGVIFSINGQTHGAIPKSIFGRDKVKMHRIADSLLVMIDCSEISVDAREDLFMNSRDRLSNGLLRNAIERQIEDILAMHPALRSLREQRQNQEISDRLEDSKPLEDVLKSILKSSPSLSELFLRGRRLSDPHKKRGGKGDEPGGENGTHPFKGKPHPTFFRFEGREYEQVLNRTCEIGRRCRLKFETDVVNDYFERTSMPGRYHVQILGEKGSEAISHSLTLHDGIGNWSIEIPDELETGAQLTLECLVNDDVNPEGFINVARLFLVAHAEKKPGKKGKRESRTESGGTVGQDEPSGIEMPKIIKVKEDQWAEVGFDRFSACEIIGDVVNKAGKDEMCYTFHINVDNICLRTDMKQSRSDPSLVEAKFVYGNVLVGLAIIKDHADRQNEKKGNEESDRNGDGSFPLYEFVKRTTRALAPFIVPMIDNLGALTDEDVSSLGQIGDQE